MKYNLIITCSVAMFLLACGKQKQFTETNDIRIDQCGYQCDGEKMAFTTLPASAFEIIDNEGNSVYKGKVGEPQYWADANDTIRRIDFSDVCAEGTYKIVIDNELCSAPFAVSVHPYADLARAAVKAYYFSRASMPVDEQYGGVWKRAAGHPDTCVMVHSSAASKQRPEGTILSLPGGWYDAGDYNKYVVNSGISTYTMLLTLEMYEALAQANNLNIPESGNTLPDILDETLYNLRWMLSMQDPNDGGVYHKLTTLNFEGFIMPNECQRQRYVVAKCTTASLDLAATAAHAYNILLKYNELQPLADSCLAIARKAYQWALKNPEVRFRNPEGVSTGEYGDWRLTDEWYWASVEMWLATGEKTFAENAKKYADRYFTPSWGSVGMLGNYSLALANGKSIDGVGAKDSILSTADYLLTKEAESPVKLSLGRYDWGSNSAIANEGMLKLIAYRLTGDTKYYKSAVNDLHYILGRNGTGYCYVTGFGSRHTMHIHHRPSSADGIEEPVPGYLSGGPCTQVPNDCGDESDIVRSQYPAKAFADQECSYSTNEVAINWNAPLTFLTWGIESR